MKWSKADIELLRALKRNGLTIPEIAKEVKRSYKSVEHAIDRYAKDIQPLLNNPVKVERKHVNELARQLGESLYHRYKVVKLTEPKPSKYKAKREEVSILDISDVHLGMINEVFDSATGKKIVTYNMDIFQQEIANLQEAVTEIHTILSNSYRLRKLVIFFLGDLVTNDRIFKEQVFEIDKVVGLQVWDAVNYFSSFFNNLLKLYDKIEIVGIVGNHGRSLPDSYSEPVENNFEYHIYKIWQKQFENSKRIKVIVPNTRRYVHKILHWKHLVEHGDSIRGFSDNSIEKQIKELAVNIDGFDVMHYGHFHKLKDREIADKVLVKQNGSWIAKDNYGFQRFKTYSTPKQHFFGCNDHRPETWAYKIDLRG